MKRLVLLLAVAGSSFGCCTVPDPQTLVPLDVLIAEHNANAAKVPYLYADVRARVKLYDPKSGLAVFQFGTLTGPSNGTLLLAKNPDAPHGPDDFALWLEESGLPILGTGVSTLQGVYYFWGGQGDRQIAAMGRTQLAGAPGTETLAIDPLQLPSTLGVLSLPADRSDPPIVTQRIKYTCPTAYVLTWADRRPISGQIVALREMYFRWETDKPRRLYKVVLLDPLGQPVMEAELSNYRSIDTSELAEPPVEPPIMPRDIHITVKDPKTLKTAAVLDLHLSGASMPALLYDEACTLQERVPRRVLRGMRMIDAKIAPVRPDAPAAPGGAL